MSEIQQSQVNEEGPVISEETENTPPPPIDATDDAKSNDNETTINKNTITTTANANANGNTTAPSTSNASAEFEPPLACVRRMLKNTLPSNTNVGKDASSAFSRACGIFIVYLTACANDFARESKRQTITAADVMAAIKVGFWLIN